MARRRDTGTNWIQIAGLIVLTVVVAILCVMALRSARPYVPNAGETPGYEGNLSNVTSVDSHNDENDTTDSASSDSDEDAGSSTATTVVPSLTRILVAQDNNVAYRATTGPCPETSAVVEVTHNGGANWSSNYVGPSDFFSAPQRLLAGQDGHVTVVALDAEDCSTISVLQSYSFGSNWDLVADGAEETWHLSPTNPAQAIAPQVGAVELPCEGARIASPSSTSAGVLCSDGRVASTSNAGEAWATSDSFAGAEGIAVTGDAYLLVQTEVEECEGTQITRLNTSLTIDAQSCVPEAHAPGETAIGGGTDGSVWLWAGNTIIRSTDAGATWE